MNMWSCESIRDQLPDLVAGRLDTAAEAEVRAHLTSCVECRAEVELLERLRRYQPAAPASLEGVVVAQIRRRARTRSVPMAGWLAIAATAALALLGVGRWLEIGEPDGASSTPTVASAEKGARGAPLDTAAIAPGAQNQIEAPEIQSDPGIVAAADEIGSTYAELPGGGTVVAGTAMLDQLSVEQLELLLAELESWSES